MTSPQVDLQRLAHRALWLTVALIVYGSLYPFEFAQPAPGAWLRFVRPGAWDVSLPDVLSNVGLFVPCGLFAALAWPRVLTGAAYCLAAIAGVLVFAAIVQGVQSFVPQRVPSLLDALWNVGGGVLGMLLTLAVRDLSIPRFGHRLQLPVLLLGLWFVAELAPFVPSLDVDRLKDALRPLLIERRFNLHVAIETAAELLAASYLVRCLFPPRRALAALVMAVGALALGKLVVLTRGIDLSSIAGWGAGLAAAAVLAFVGEARRRTLVVLGVLAGYSIVALHPYAFTLPPGPFSWVPFADVLTGNMLSNTQALLPRVFLITALLWIPGGRIRPVAVGLALWIALLELAQTLLPGRTASITEPVLVVLLAWVLVRVRLLDPRLARDWRPPASPWQRARTGGVQNRSRDSVNH